MTTNCVFPKYILLQQLTLLIINILPSFYNGLIMVAQLVAAEGQYSLQFNYAPSNFSSSSPSGLLHTGSVQFSNSTMWMLYDPATLSANASNNLIGRVVYNKPIAFTSTSSFNTSFSLQITVTGVNETTDCPSGIAFFISPDGATPPDNSGGHYFGLVNPDTINNITNHTADPFFAVVFDGTKDGDLPGNSYIGIDINSLDPGYALVHTSNPNAGYYPDFIICNNHTFTVWISYNASSQTTQVWMTSSPIKTNAATQDILAGPPDSSQMLKNKRDIYSDVFSKNDTWYVGFSVTNYKVGSPPASVAIRSWHFSIDNNGSVSGRASTNLKLIVPLVLATSAVVASCILLLIYEHRRRMRRTKQISNGTYINIESIANLHKFTYRDLKSSTRGFDPNTSLIGEGGFSKVYKGILPDGSIIAIKRLKDSLRKEGEFASELRIISSIRHRNLLQLQGWSYDKGEALLVYNFMSNGSLEQYLFGSKKGTLDGDTRLKILQGVAAALEYLHSGLGECILHRDVKAANVMLTEDFEAVLGDFGLARLIKHNAIVTATMVGTPGYVAPEIFMTGKVTDKVDVYSFGILMLEVACGLPAINRALDAEYLYLTDWISRLQSNNDVLHGLDPSILMLCLDSNLISSGKEQWKRVLELALMCCHFSPNSRPPMRYVNQYIQDVINDPWMINPSQLSFKSHIDINGDEEGYLNYINFFSPSSKQSNSTSLKYSTDYFFSNNSNATPNH